MFGKSDPTWAAMVQDWKAQQLALRKKMVVAPLKKLPRFIAGADAAFSKDKSTVFAAAVIFDRIDKKIIEVAHATAPAEIPYVPGFLSFREGPAVLSAIRKLRGEFGVILFDGQGFAHPRRCGLATHLSVTLGAIGVGVGKSRLIGTFDEPPKSAGSFSRLLDQDEQIGIVLRTRDNLRPVFVSVGNKIDLPGARELVMACCTKYRIPEPTRQADREVALLKQRYAD